jgi:hypothetical protein
MIDTLDQYRIVETLTESQVSDLIDLLKMLAATDVIIGWVDEGEMKFMKRKNP